MLKKDFLTSSVRKARENAYARATVWIILGQVANRFLALLNNVAIARLLSPEILGVIAIVNSINQGATLFSEIGVNQNIVRSSRGEDPNFYNTAWTIQVVRGFILFFIICLLSYPLAKFFEIDQLLYIFPVAGVGFILSGLMSTAFATLQRRLFQKRLVLANLACQIIGIVVLISYALASPTVWALVFGILAQLAAQFLISHRVLPDIANRIHFDISAFLEIFHFGKWIFLIGIFTYLARELDTIIFAKLMSISMLGIYSISKLLSYSIIAISQKFNVGVIFPYYSRQPENPITPKKFESEKNLYIYTLTASSIIIAGFVSVGDIIVDVVYGERYSAAGWMFSLLCVGVWFLVLAGIISHRLIGEGRPQLVLVALIAKLAAFIGSVFYLFEQFELLGAVSAVIIGNFISYLALVVVRREFDKPHLRLEVAFTCLFLALAIAANYGRAMLGFEYSIAELLQ